MSASFADTNSVFNLIFYQHCYIYLIIFIRSTHKIIPPGVNDVDVDDNEDDRDGATEVQTNFYHSQYYTMITTKSKIIRNK